MNKIYVFCTIDVSPSAFNCSSVALVILSYFVVECDSLCTLLDMFGTMQTFIIM
jgi:hypothetical protein